MEKGIVYSIPFFDAHNLAIYLTNHSKIKSSKTANIKLGDIPYCQNYIRIVASLLKFFNSEDYL